MPPNGAWHHLVATINGTTGKIYKNGIEAVSGTVNAAVDASSTIQMGRFNNSYFFNGSLDEVRISNAVRSADWIKTEYNNQSDPSSFISVSSEETPPMLLSTIIPSYKFTGACLSNTLVTLYNNDTTPMLPSVVCSDGTYTIVPKMEPGDYSITACQSNRK